VFAFDSDNKSMTTHDGTRAHKRIKIDIVKAINRVTDSAIIEIFPNINIDPLAMALSSGDDQRICKITLLRPFTTDADASDDLPSGQRLVMFGAARSGMIGVRVEVNSRDDKVQYQLRSHLK
jgi:hypothetical protein